MTQLREGNDFNYFKMGGVLSVIQANSWFAPHATLKDYMENEHGIKYTRALTWIRIYNKLLESGLAWDSVKTIGWTKLMPLTEVLTKGNVKTWVKQAEKLTLLNLKEAIKAHILADKQKALGTDTSPQLGPPVVTKTFKMHEDQKSTIDEALQKAKDASKTAYDTVALEYICLDFLAGTATASSIAGQLQKLGLDDALEAFAQAFPNVSLTAEVEEAAAAAG